MSLLKISEYAKINNLHPNTVRSWIKEGKIKSVTTEGGHYRIPEEQILIKPKLENKKFVIGYCRVSSTKQKDDLKRQIEIVKTYLISQGKQFQIIKDIGSGINYKKNGLQELITMILSNNVSKIVVLHKDRLLRFGFELIESICKRFNVEIEIIEEIKKDSEQELVEDLVQIITVFSARLNGKKSNQLKKIAKQL